MALVGRPSLRLVSPHRPDAPPSAVAVVTVTLRGEFDISVERDLTALLAPAEESTIAVIDCTDVTFFDSSALECLLRLRNRMAVRHGTGEVRVVGANDSLVRLFSVTGLDRIFSMYANVEQAAAVTA